MTENERFKVRFDGWRYFLVVDVPNEKLIARMDTKGDADAVKELIEIYEGLR